MEKEKMLSMCNAVASYVMDIQQQSGCKVTKANSKRLIDSLIEFGVDRESAKYIESKILA